MTGGGHEVPVPGKQIEALQAFVSCERVGHDRAHVMTQPSVDFPKQGEPPVAPERLKEGRNPNRRVVAFGEILEKIPPALEEIQTPANPGLQPQRVRNHRAVATLFGAANQLKKGLEKFRVYD